MKAYSLKTCSAKEFLKKILNNYPEGGQIIQEAYQNAEDAQATEFGVFIDHGVGKTSDSASSSNKNSTTGDFKVLKKGRKDTSSTGNKLITAEEAERIHQTAAFRSICEEQSALIFWNDGVFSADDITSFERMYESEKAQKPGKIGQYGLGSRAYFHVSDFIIVLSGDNLLVVDPTEQIFPGAGGSYSIKELEAIVKSGNYGSDSQSQQVSQKIPKSSQTSDEEEDSIVADDSTPIDEKVVLDIVKQMREKFKADEKRGTVIRLPLRTIVSEGGGVSGEGLDSLSEEVAFQAREKALCTSTYSIPKIQEILHQRFVVTDPFQWFLFTLSVSFIKVGEYRGMEYTEWLYAEVNVKGSSTSDIIGARESETGGERNNALTDDGKSGCTDADINPKRRKIDGKKEKKKKRSKNPRDQIGSFLRQFKNYDALKRGVEGSNEVLPNSVYELACKSTCKLDCFKPGENKDAITTTAAFLVSVEMSKLPDLWKWVANLKTSPVAGIAIELARKEEQGGKLINGEKKPSNRPVFTYLPLPFSVGLPVYVNGDFQLHDNRRDLWSAAADDVRGTAKEKGQWNTALCERVLPMIYSGLLENVGEREHWWSGNQFDSANSEGPSVNSGEAESKDGERLSLERYFSLFPGKILGEKLYWTALQKQTIKNLLHIPGMNGKVPIKDLTVLSEDFSSPPATRDAAMRFLCPPTTELCIPSLHCPLYVEQLLISQMQTSMKGVLSKEVFFSDYFFQNVSNFIDQENGKFKEHYENFQAEIVALPSPARAVALPSTPRVADGGRSTSMNLSETDFDQLFQCFLLFIAELDNKEKIKTFLGKITSKKDVGKAEKVAEKNIAETESTDLLLTLRVLRLDDGSYGRIGEILDPEVSDIKALELPNRYFPAKQFQSNPRLLQGLRLCGGLKSVLDWHDCLDIAKEIESEGWEAEEFPPISGSGGKNSSSNGVFVKAEQVEDFTSDPDEDRRNINDDNDHNNKDANKAYEPILDLELLEKAESLQEYISKKLRSTPQIPEDEGLSYKLLFSEVAWIPQKLHVKSKALWCGQKGFRTCKELVSNEYMDALFAVRPVAAWDLAQTDPFMVAAGWNKPPPRSDFLLQIKKLRTSIAQKPTESYKVNLWHVLEKISTASTASDVVNKEIQEVENEGPPKKKARTDSEVLVGPGDDDGQAPKSLEQELSFLDFLPIGSGSTSGLAAPKKCCSNQDESFEPLLLQLPFEYIPFQSQLASLGVEKVSHTKISSVLQELKDRGEDLSEEEKTGAENLLKVWAKINKKKSNIAARRSSVSPPSANAAGNNAAARKNSAAGKNTSTTDKTASASKRTKSKELAKKELQLTYPDFVVCDCGTESEPKAKLIERSRVFYNDSTNKKKKASSTTQSQEEEATLYPMTIEFSRVDALHLDVKPLSEILCADGDDEENEDGRDEDGRLEGESFGQYVALADRIRNVLEEYHDAGTGIGTVCNESVQNFDDRGAKEVCFVIDARSHGIDNLINDSMACLQGPALLITGDSEFLERDFADIQRVGKSGKRDRFDMDGQFGVGLNANYHITDAMQLRSRRKVGFFDPLFQHVRAGENGGDGRPGRLFKEENLEKHYPDQLAAFDIEKPQGQNGAPSLKAQDGKELGCPLNVPTGTQFRLPIRQKKSNLKRKVFPIEEYVDELREWAAKNAWKCQIFSRSVQKVRTIYIDETGKVEILREYAVRKYQTCPVAPHIPIPSVVIPTIAAPNYSDEGDVHAGGLQNTPTGQKKEKTLKKETLLPPAGSSDKKKSTKNGNNMDGNNMNSTSGNSMNSMSGNNMSASLSSASSISPAQAVAQQKLLSRNSPQASASSQPFVPAQGTLATQGIYNEKNGNLPPGLAALVQDPDLHLPEAGSGVCAGSASEFYAMLPKTIDDISEEKIETNPIKSSYCYFHIVIERKTEDEILPEQLEFVVALYFDADKLKESRAFLKEHDIAFLPIAGVAIPLRVRERVEHGNESESRDYFPGSPEFTKRMQLVNEDHEYLFRFRPLRSGVQKQAGTVTEFFMHGMWHLHSSRMLIEFGRDNAKFCWNRMLMEEVLKIAYVFAFVGALGTLKLMQDAELEKFRKEEDEKDRLQVLNQDAKDENNIQRKSAIIHKSRLTLPAVVAYSNLLPTCSSTEDHLDRKKNKDSGSSTDPWQHFADLCLQSLYERQIPCVPVCHTLPNTPEHKGTSWFLDQTKMALTIKEDILCCAITAEIMDDPVFTKKSPQQLIDRAVVPQLNGVHPLTREQVTPDSWITNAAMKEIASYLANADEDSPKSKETETSVKGFATLMGRKYLGLQRPAITSFGRTVDTVFSGIAEDPLRATTTLLPNEKILGEHKQLVEIIEMVKKYEKMQNADIETVTLENAIKEAHGSHIDWVPFSQGVFDVRVLHQYFQKGKTSMSLYFTETRVMLRHVMSIALLSYNTQKIILSAMKNQDRKISELSPGLIADALRNYVDKWSIFEERETVSLSDIGNQDLMIRKKSWVLSFLRLLLDPVWKEKGMRMDVSENVNGKNFLCGLPLLLLHGNHLTRFPNGRPGNMFQKKFYRSDCVWKWPLKTSAFLATEMKEFLSILGEPDFLDWKTVARHPDNIFSDEELEILDSGEPLPWTAAREKWVAGFISLVKDNFNGKKDDGGGLLRFNANCLKSEQYMPLLSRLPLVTLSGKGGCLASSFRNKVALPFLYSRDEAHAMELCRGRDGGVSLGHRCYTFFSNKLTNHYAYSVLVKQKEPYGRPNPHRLPPSRAQGTIQALSPRISREECHGPAQFLLETPLVDVLLEQPLFDDVGCRWYDVSCITGVTKCVAEGLEILKLLKPEAFQSREDRDDFISFLPLLVPIDQPWYFTTGRGKNGDVPCKLMECLRTLPVFDFLDGSIGVFPSNNVDNNSDAWGTNVHFVHRSDIPTILTEDSAANGNDAASLRSKFFEENFDEKCIVISHLGLLPYFAELAKRAGACNAPKWYKNDILMHMAAKLVDMSKNAQVSDAKMFEWLTFFQEELATVPPLRQQIVLQVLEEVCFIPCGNAVNENPGANENGSAQRRVSSGFYDPQLKGMKHFLQASDFPLNVFAPHLPFLRRIGLRTSFLAEDFLRHARDIEARQRQLQNQPEYHNLQASVAELKKRALMLVDLTLDAIVNREMRDQNLLAQLRSINFIPSIGMRLILVDIVEPQVEGGHDASGGAGADAAAAVDGDVAVVDVDAVDGDGNANAARRVLQKGIEVVLDQAWNSFDNLFLFANEWRGAFSCGDRIAYEHRPDPEEGSAKLYEASLLATLDAQELCRGLLKFKSSNENLQQQHRDYLLRDSPVSRFIDGSRLPLVLRAENMAENQENEAADDDNINYETCYVIRNDMKGAIIDYLDCAFRRHARCTETFDVLCGGVEMIKRVPTDNQLAAALYRVVPGTFPAGRERHTEKPNYGKVDRNVTHCSLKHAKFFAALLKLVFYPVAHSPGFPGLEPDPVAFVKDIWQPYFSEGASVQPIQNAPSGIKDSYPLHEVLQWKTIPQSILRSKEFYLWLLQITLGSSTLRNEGNAESHLVFPNSNWMYFYKAENITYDVESENANVARNGAGDSSSGSSSHLINAASSGASSSPDVPRPLKMPKINDILLARKKDPAKQLPKIDRAVFEVLSQQYKLWIKKNIDCVEEEIAEFRLASERVPSISINTGSSKVTEETSHENVGTQKLRDLVRYLSSIDFERALIGMGETFGMKEDIKTMIKSRPEWKICDYLTTKFRYTVKSVDGRDSSESKEVPFFIETKQKDSESFIEQTIVYIHSNFFEMVRGYVQACTIYDVKELCEELIAKSFGCCEKEFPIPYAILKQVLDKSQQLRFSEKTLKKSPSKIKRNDSDAANTIIAANSMNNMNSMNGNSMNGMGIIMNSMNPTTNGENMLRETAFQEWGSALASALYYGIVVDPCHILHESEVVVYLSKENLREKKFLQFKLVKITKIESQDVSKKVKQEPVENVDADDDMDADEVEQNEEGEVAGVMTLKQLFSRKYHVEGLKHVVSHMELLRYGSDASNLEWIENEKQNPTHYCNENDDDAEERSIHDDAEEKSDDEAKEENDNKKNHGARGLVKEKESMELKALFGKEYDPESISSEEQPYHALLLLRQILRLRKQEKVFTGSEPVLTGSEPGENVEKSLNTESIDEKLKTLNAMLGHDFSIELQNFEAECEISQVDSFPETLYRIEDEGIEDDIQDADDYGDDKDIGDADGDAFSSESVSRVESPLLGELGSRNKTLKTVRKSGKKLPNILKKSMDKRSDSTLLEEGLVQGTLALSTAQSQFPSRFRPPARRTSTLDDRKKRAVDYVLKAKRLFKDGQFLLESRESYSCFELFPLVGFNVLAALVILQFGFGHFVLRNLGDRTNRLNTMLKRLEEDIIGKDIEIKKEDGVETTSKVGVETNFTNSIVKSPAKKPNLISQISNETSGMIEVSSSSNKPADSITGQESSNSKPDNSTAGQEDTSSTASAVGVFRGSTNDDNDGSTSSSSSSSNAGQNLMNENSMNGSNITSASVAGGNLTVGAANTAVRAFVTALQQEPGKVRDAVDFLGLYYDERQTSRSQAKAEVLCGHSKYLLSLVEDI